MPFLTAALLFAGSYLAGAIPFGYLVARAKGVNLFQTGSGNIGATNVGRVLGRKFGILVFVLDFAKGALPVAAAGALRDGEIGPPGLLPTGAGLFAFLGHLFPVYLGFHGGKGVATGAGVVSVLVPGPAAAAVAAWVVVVLASRYVSLASVAAVAVLAAVRLGTPEPFDRPNVVVTAFCLVGAGMVVVKHRGNVRRLAAGNENQLGDRPVRHTLLKVLHVLALGFWFGGAAFFSFVVAPTQNTTFKEVVATAPSDRTAFVPIVPPDRADDRAKADLASALFGAAVGPVFPKFFLMQLVCGGVALVTSLAWWNSQPGRRLHRTRAITVGVAVLTVAAGWWVSGIVSDLRIERFHPDQAVAAAARTDFAAWHFVSLGMSALTTLLAGVGLAMAAALPVGPAVPGESKS